ncbi:hypothetical protein B7494_g5287 [Chlorociboria aeruginascens]|nr:hypothetical protein B7494_g5287 [Chlorociboria aeruginascens]
MPFKTIIKLVRKLWSKKSTTPPILARPTTPPENRPTTPPILARPTTPPTLARLPPELIVHMVQFLPLSSAALFTLSCRAIYNILGTHYWTSLWTEGQHPQHIEFLSQLSKDLPPDYIPCYHCRVLHFCSLGDSHHSSYWVPFELYGSLCRAAESNGRVSKYFHSNFNFRIFQMAMKRHRLGLDYEPWLKYLSLESTTCRINEKFPSEFKADVKIVDDSLLFRSQRVILIPPGLTIRGVDHNTFDLCPHIRFMDYGGRANLPETAGCTLNHQHGLQRCIRKSRIVPCTACPTEYEFSFEECEEFGVAVIITKWMDLGEGQTILDPKWLSHLDEEYTTSRIFWEIDSTSEISLVDKNPVQSNRISIRDSFGQDISSGPDSLEIAARLFSLPKRR